jgi:hypothetical protein
MATITVLIHLISLMNDFQSGQICISYLRNLYQGLAGMGKQQAGLVQTILGVAWRERISKVLAEERSRFGISESPHWPSAGLVSGAFPWPISLKYSWGNSFTELTLTSCGTVCQG